jgi:molecular chaperone DnaK
VVLRNLQAAERAGHPIEVMFQLAADGTLSVRATELNSGAVQELRIESRTSLSPNEEKKLTEEQAAWAAGRAAGDEANRRPEFERLLVRSEKFVRLLQHSAQENPSEEAESAIARARALLDQGRAALASEDAARMAELRREIIKLVR